MRAVLAVGHRVEADQDVRQPGGSEHQRKAERHEVDLAGGREAVLEAGVEEVGLAGLVDRCAEHLRDVEVEVQQDQERDEDRAGHQQHGLHDLHPRGALHAADGDVEDHQQADADDDPVLGTFVGHAEQQRDKCARADHLGEQVEDRHDHGRRRRRRPNRPLPHPVRELVGHRVATGVAQQLGDEEQGHQPGDEEADRVEEAVVPRQGDRAGDAEEGRRGHVVTGDCEAVLRAGERAAAGVVVGGAARLAARPERDADRDDHDGDEQRGGESLVVGPGREVGRRTHRPTSVFGPASSLYADSMRSAIGSRSLLACRA